MELSLTLQRWFKLCLSWRALSSNWLDLRNIWTILNCPFVRMSSFWYKWKTTLKSLKKLSSKHFVTIILVNSPINVQQTIENCGRPSPFQNDKPSRGAEGESRLSELCIPVIDLLSTPCSHNWILTYVVITKDFLPWNFSFFFFWISVSH